MHLDYLSLYKKELMKRIFTSLLFSCFLFTSAFAQLSAGSIAPNFTVVDDNGVEYELYDILAEGKSVFLDMFAVWCGPCWNYHQQHVLEDLYQQYGPDGTNEAMVFALEVDPSTAPATIYGGGNSIGDWTVGVSYPVIDAPDLNEAYEIAYYPTIYMVCPDKRVREVGQQGLAVQTNNISTCAAPLGEFNVEILDYLGDDGLFCGTKTVAPTLQIQNLGTGNIFIAQVEALINGNSAGFTTWTGDIATWELADITLDPITLTEDTELELKVVSINNSPDADESNNSYDVIYYKALEGATQEITVELLTDSYGHETYWELRGDDGTVYGSGGNQAVGPDGGGAPYTNNPNGAGAYGNNELITETVTVPTNGCYDFVIVDDFGDGMCCNFGNGYFKVIDGNGTTLISGGSFTAEAEDPFSVDAVLNSNEISILDQIQLFPNPTSSMLNVQLDMTSTADLNMTVFNTLGQAVEVLGNRTFVAGQHNIEIDVTNFSAGVYFLNIQNGAEQSNYRFSVSR